MANCEHKSGCAERATKILSVGSLGRVETLCERHVADEVRQLEPNLIPFHLTGIDAPFTGEQSLEERLGVLDGERKQLLAKIEDQQHENTRLRDVLMQRLGEENSRLLDELEKLEAEHAELSEHEHAEPVTRVD